MFPYEIRSAQKGDEEELLSVAHYLNTVNLPAKRREIEEILHLSCLSFSGELKDRDKCEYVFVLVDKEKNEIIGSSMIVAQLGRKDAPYIYVDVMGEERYSSTLDKHFSHTVLKMGYSYEGPTEIGGLVLKPEYRETRLKLGQFLSYVRFLFMGMHRTWFRDQILAELLPPLEPDLTSHFWNAFGRHFTEMSYAEADVLSKKNKEFIRGLFPDGVIYASLLSKEAQDVIGKVGVQTRGVEKMLRRIGFRYANRIDPFDGGPHFVANTDEIYLVQHTRKMNLNIRRGGEGAKFSERSETKVDLGEWVRSSRMLAMEGKGSSKDPYFRAVLAQVDFSVPPEWCAEGQLPQGEVSAEVAELLGLGGGEEVWSLSFELPQKGVAGDYARH